MDITDLEMEVNNPDGWGNLLHSLSFSDVTPENFRDLGDVLLRIANRLATEGPLARQLRQRQVLALLRQRRIRGASALLKAARAEVRKAPRKPISGEGEQQPQ
jgi:hypothetical protein